ncbi:MAG: hypothetical protein H6629_15730 [Calditrichae bacterium]|nr:hypothetical protein [Calditrichia bacterium]
MDIWKEDKYRFKRKELLSLMKDKKFEICFKFDDKTYLAPQLLPVDEIEYECTWFTRQFVFEYRYRFMPKGILTRFIVKRNKDIFENKNWRYGVLLNFDKTFALVKELYFDRKIVIQLTGENKRVFRYYSEINSRNT